VLTVIMILMLACTIVLALGILAFVAYGVAQAAAGREFEGLDRAWNSDISELVYDLLVKRSDELNAALA
jgi:hypothetical protein